jgi:hypothetical protein
MTRSGSCSSAPQVCAIDAAVLVIVALRDDSSWRPLEPREHAPALDADEQPASVGAIGAG